MNQQQIFDVITNLQERLEATERQLANSVRHTNQLRVTNDRFERHIEPIEEERNQQEEQSDSSFASSAPENIPPPQPPNNNVKKFLSNPWSMLNRPPTASKKEYDATSNCPISAQPPSNFLPSRHWNKMPSPHGTMPSFNFSRSRSTQYLMATPVKTSSRTILLIKNSILFFMMSSLLLSHLQ